MDMTNGQPQPAAPAQTAAQPGASGAADPVNRVFLAAVKAIHTPQVTSQLLQMIRAIGDPAQALAKAATFVMKGLFDKSKGKIPPEAIGPAMKKIVTEIGIVATAAKLMTVSDQIIDQAMTIIGQQMQQSQGAAPAQPAQPAPQAAGGLIGSGAA